MNASDQLLERIMVFRSEMARAAVDDGEEFAAVICGALDVARINLYAGQSRFDKVDAIIKALELQKRDSRMILNVPK